MIGDALRGEFLLSRDFSQRVTHPLAQEPTVLAPRRSAVKRITVYALSAAAALSAIALVGPTMGSPRHALGGRADELDLSRMWREERGFRDGADTGKEQPWQ